MFDLNENFQSLDLNGISDDDEPPSRVGHELKSTNNNPTDQVTTDLMSEAAMPSLNFKKKYFPDASLSDWNNWRWQLSNSFTNTVQLSRILKADSSEQKPLTEFNDMLPLRITPYYASLIVDSDANHPIRKSIVPTVFELTLSPGENSDPLSEEGNSPVPNLVHRYPDRVLFLSTGFCSAYCRYCTRSHMVAKDKCHVGKKAWEPAFQYIEQHPEIRDVIVSGGDPLTMPDSHIEYLLSRLRAIAHVEIIRIGTKVPAVLPQRITPALIAILKKFHPLFMSLHFTHPLELTPETAKACEKLANAGIPLGSQTVLLQGINDDAAVMTSLMQGLLKIRVKPYYLYQCDPIPGSAHFRTPVSKGLEIIKALRGFTSGYAVPQYVIDAPGGGGKIPLLPEYVQGYDGGDLILKNYEGKLFRYPDVDFDS